MCAGSRCAVRVTGEAIGECVHHRQDSPQVTLKVYAHWLRDERTTAMQELASAVCDTTPAARYRRGVSGNQVVTEKASEAESVAVSS